MNKKLIKTITCVALGLGAASSIPFTAISCKTSEAWPNNAIPKKYLEIDSEGTIIGFKSDFPEDYSSYDTLLIPKEVITINVSSFKNKPLNSNIKFLAFEKESKLNKFVLNRTVFANIIDIDISNCINLYEISNGQFLSMSLLQKISLPRTIQQIYANAFKNCTSLKLVNLSECTQLQHIGENAFYSCKSLSNLYIPRNVNNIGAKAFYDCFNLNVNNVSIDSKNNYYGRATNTGDNSFILVKKDENKKCLYSLQNTAVGCLMLGKIEFSNPDFFKENAFQGATIDELVIPPTLSKLDQYVLHDANIRNVDFSNATNLQTIDQYCFEGLKTETIDLSKCTNLTTILGRAFKGVEVQKLVLPKNLEEIAKDTFLDAEVEDFEIDSSNQNFVICASFVNAKVLIKRTSDNPNNLWTNKTTIVGGLGVGDVDLSKTNITELADSAFENGCSIYSIKFPTSLTTIGVSAFGDFNQQIVLDFSMCGSITIKREFTYRSKIKKLIFKRVSQIQSYAFMYSNCNEIHWVGLSSDPQTTFASDCFGNIYDQLGYVYADDAQLSYNSNKLLTFLKSKGLPSVWRAGN